ncbi:MAG: SDR family oxidoreductase [Nitrospinae bacterium]|nr:SDR family oxidoreductase [Nitrospinota bacterium]
MRQVFVTGASSDIGIATCRKFLEEGYRVIGHFNLGQESFFDLVDSSPNISSLQIDLSKPGNIESLLLENENLVNETDVLINLAAISNPKSFSEITAEDIVEAMGVNFIPSLLFIRSITPGMIKRRWGRIVNAGSIGVKFGGGSKNYCYSLSKHALELFPADHKAWAANNVFINTLRIGVTDTKIHKNDPGKDMNKRVEMIPANRMASPEEMANIIYWLGSDQNAYITGQVISASGGE